MSDRIMRAQEVSTIYFEIIRQLNSGSLPDWLQLDLTFQQMKVLHILKKNGSLKMRQLSEELGVTMPTITGIVNRLIDRRDGKALLTRQVSSEDRREVWANLTPAGSAALEYLNQLNIKTLQQALIQLSEADLESIHGPLLRLSEAVFEQKQAAEPAPANPLEIEGSSLTPAFAPVELDVLAEKILSAL